MFGYPDAWGRRAGRIEHIDGDAATGIPIAANAQPFWRQKIDQSFGDGDGTAFMKGRVITVGRQIKLQRFTFDNPIAR